MPFILPDVLAHGLDIVFCGTAAGSASARQGAYYAGPGNAFWSTLHRVGLTPHTLQAAEYAQLTQWGMGFTDLAKTVAGSDSALSRAHFNGARLRELILEYQPRIIAFTGKRAAEEFIQRRVEYGLLSDTSGVTRLFVLTSPSGSARRYWSEHPWRELSRLRCTGR